MKKLGGQKELVDDNYPVLENEELAAKLEEMYTLYEPAKQFRKLNGEVKEAVKGFVLTLSPEDRGAGNLKCGDFIVPFKITEAKPEDVNYTTKGGTKVKLTLKPETPETEE